MYKNPEGLKSPNLDLPTGIPGPLAFQGNLKGLDRNPEQLNNPQELQASRPEFQGTTQETRDHADVLLQHYLDKHKELPSLSVKKDLEQPIEKVDKDLFAAFGFDPEVFRPEQAQKADFTNSMHMDFNESRERFSREDLYSHSLFGSRLGGGNCWAYALDLPTKPDGTPYEKFTKPYPGYYAGVDHLTALDEIDAAIAHGSLETTKSVLEKYMHMDMEALGREMEEVDKDYQPKEGERKIAVVAAPFVPIGMDYAPDFHFHVEGKDRLWSHKQGLQNPTNLDNSGKKIEDPATCDRGYYTKFIGYYVIRKKEMEV